MSHLSPFYDDFFLKKFNFKDWIFHSALFADQNYANEME